MMVHVGRMTVFKNQMVVTTGYTEYIISVDKERNNNQLPFFFDDDDDRESGFVVLGENPTKVVDICCSSWHPNSEIRNTSFRG